MQDDKDDAFKKFRDAVNGLKDVTDNLLLLGQVMRDSGDLDDFRFAKASVYFNEKAACAESAEARETSEKLSRYFSKLAKVSEIARTDGEPTPEQEKLLQELETEDFSVSDQEWDAIDAYAYAQIDEFIGANLLRWERMKQHSPDIVAKIETFRK